MKIGLAAMALAAAFTLGGATVRLETDRGKYQIGESDKAVVTVALGNLPAEPLTCRWTLEDIAGTRLDGGEFVAAGEPRRIALALPADGYYRFRAALAAATGASHGAAETALLRTKFTAGSGWDRAGRWAVNGHSRTEEYPNLRKLGITMSRLDIPWMSLEPKPGEWDYAGADKVAAASRRDGVLLLGILGKNPKWLKLPPGQGSDREKFLDYVRRTVSRYRNDIFYWDLWNEPQYTWGGSKAEFGLLMRDAYRIIKEIQPESVVVYNGHPFEGELRGYTLDNLAALDGDMPFDAMGMHPYCRPLSPDANRFLEHMTNIRTLLERIAPGRELWISELGWPTSTDENGVTEPEQAAYLQRAALLGLAAGVKKFVWYMPYSGNNKAYHESEYGFFRNDLTPKPALAAYAFLIRVLDNLEFRREIPLGEAVRCLEFGDGDRSVFALWATGEPVRLAADWPDAVRIRRGDGSPLPVSGEMEVGILPLFLDGPDVSSSLEKARLTLAQPVRVESATVVPEGLLLVLRNRAGRELDVEAKLELPPGAAFRKASAAAGMRFRMGREPKEILVGVNFPRPPFSGAAMLTLRADGVTRTAAIPLRLEAATFGTPGNPVRLGAIGDIAPADMQKEWRGPDDLSCEARFGWNAAGLLFAIRVRDDRHENNFDASKIWSGDSLQMAVRAAPGTVPDYYDVHTAEIGLALTSAGTERVVYAGQRGESFTGRVTRIEAEKSTLYEGAIPWRLLGLNGAPPAGTLLSWNFIVNDRDPGGGRKWVQLSPGIGAEKNPSRYPRFILHGPESIIVREQ